MKTRFEHKSGVAKSFWQQNDVEGIRLCQHEADVPIPQIPAVGDMVFGSSVHPHIMIKIKIKRGETPKRMGFFVLPYIMGF